ncbi:DUF5641 domain-containing protein [Trichonephila clavipes]|uniref:DUF5641 domain-containing protein n=1 Tax=Trichonephila clavipes TaxID=2585209 RepID=A0A8X7BGA2_TRICX|nr:DUF5641 domain-containing protein [Trichonephila clavipes]
MGNLPKHRDMLERSFFSCGCYILVKCSKGQGNKYTKGYIALFVCLASKAVHIEAVGDKTTDSFIATLRHFSACHAPPILAPILLELRPLGFATEYQTLLLEEAESSDFFSSLQPCEKWQDAQPNLKEDDFMLIKEEGPPGTWPMARVLQVHPGNDGLVRFATVKNQDSVYKRPVISSANFL